MAGAINEVTDANFQAEVLESETAVLVDFWAPWCGPCRVIAPTLEEINEERDNLRVVKLNVDENPDIAERYGVQGIPFVGLFRNGRLERASVGAKPRTAIEGDLGLLVIP